MAKYDSRVLSTEAEYGVPGRVEYGVVSLEGVSTKYLGDKHGSTARFYIGTVAKIPSLSQNN